MHHVHRDHLTWEGRLEKLGLRVELGLGPPWSSGCFAIKASRANRCWGVSQFLVHQPRLGHHLDLAEGDVVESMMKSQELGGEA